LQRFTLTQDYLLQIADACSHVASVHTCDTMIGNSGSPLFETIAGNRSEWLVRAVHFAGLQDSSHNLAIPIDDDLFQWIDCYRRKQPSCAPATFMKTLEE
jgi:hypothetical protein